ncbi:MAG: hypothetical protein DRR08_29265 [Candidatus Parabeggiatoa sp. nov. 2]|nr:MAG: hypothetical protein B6247_18045 [Beggiatoa sp. 4572_84]RKZ51450.1 MAG: hypothetical protein DRR08_29265 [Gammaproteobacteria bacterium]
MKRLHDYVILLRVIFTDLKYLPYITHSQQMRMGNKKWRMSREEAQLIIIKFYINQVFEDNYFIELNFFY